MGKVTNDPKTWGQDARERQADITGSSTFGQSQRHVPRQSDVTGGMASTFSRVVQGAPNQNRRTDDSPTTMAKNRSAVRKGK